MEKKSSQSQLLVTSSGVILNDYLFHVTPLLNKTETKSLLRKFLSTERNGESLECLEAILELKVAMETRSCSPDALIPKVVKIVSQFLLEGAPKEVNISSSVRDDAMTSIIDALSAKVSSTHFLAVSPTSSSGDRSPRSPNTKKREAIKAFFLCAASSNKLPEKWNSYAYTPFSVFEDVYMFLLIQLERDSLPRFLRSKSWLQFITKKDLSFVHSVGEKRENTLFNYTDLDLTHPVVTDHDFIMADKIVADSYDWDLQGYHSSKEEGCISGYFGKINYLDKVSWMSNGGNTAKYEGIVPYPFDLCVRALLPLYNMTEYDTNLARVQELEYLNTEQLAARLRRLGHGELSASKYPYRALGVYDVGIKLVWPFKTPRRLLITTSMAFDAEKEELKFIDRPCELPEHPLPSGHIECKDYIIFYITKLDANRTKYTQIHLNNMFGWLSSSSVQKYSTMDRAKNLNKNILRLLEMEKQGKGKPYDASDSYCKMIEAAQIELLRKARKTKSMQQHMQLTQCK